MLNQSISALNVSDITVGPRHVWKDTQHCGLSWPQVQMVKEMTEKLVKPDPAGK